MRALTLMWRCNAPPDAQYHRVYLFCLLWSRSDIAVNIALLTADTPSSPPSPHTHTVQQRMRNVGYAHWPLERFHWLRKLGKLKLVYGRSSKQDFSKCPVQNLQLITIIWPMPHKSGSNWTILQTEQHLERLCSWLRLKKNKKKTLNAADTWSEFWAVFFFLFLKYWKCKKNRKLQRIAAFGRVKFFTNIRLICLRRHFTFIDRANSQQQLPQGTLCCQDPTISKRLATVGKKSSLLGQNLPQQAQGGSIFNYV